jgi:hypothetical protein
VAPSTITLTSPPDAGAGADLPVPRDKPFAATWTGASSGNVVLYFDIATSTEAFALTCRFDPSDGTGEVPAEALAHLPAGTGSFNFYVLEQTSATPGEWKIGFSASSTVVDGSGSATTGYASFD